MKKEDKKIIANGRQLFCREYILPDESGEEVLVLLHDSWGGIESWGDFPQALAQIFGLNILIYDRAGFGKSPDRAGEAEFENYHLEAARELSDLLDVLEIDRALLFGHSDGATIALLAAAHFPEKIKGVMAETPHTFIEEKGRKAVRETVEKAQSSSLLQSLERLHGDRAEAVFRRWHELWLSPKMDDWNILPELKKIQCPVLAMRGSEDPFDTDKQLSELFEYIEAPLMPLFIPEAGHTPRKDNPVAVIDAIETFNNDYF